LVKRQLKDFKLPERLPPHLIRVTAMTVVVDLGGRTEDV
jgi:hypothetical protein